MRVHVSFDDWVKQRHLVSMGTNAGAGVLPFQMWCHFKEAFAPEVVARAVKESDIAVGRCLDPCGGSGTTALACQFLGVEPVTIEVNPYLAELIEAKLCGYDIASLAKDVGHVAEEAADMNVDCNSLMMNGPSTLVEPGINDRWVFDLPVADRIISIRQCIDRVPDKRNRRLMRVILGGQLVNFSNVRISGKGRRYRNRWHERKVAPETVLVRFVEALSAAVRDITSHRNRPTKSYDVKCGDARTLVRAVEPVDVVVFSPPYPNSFDYTDVYNLELWMLGYLKSRSDNADLRQATLTSHVQLQRDYAIPPSSSPALASVLEQLMARKTELWHRDIPSMVGGYFADLAGLLQDLRFKLREGGQVHMVVGDSRYAGVTVPVAEIVSELAPSCGFDVIESDPFRSMRASAQQGGSNILPETLIVLG